MNDAITMQSVGDVLKKLMGKWELALNETCVSGDWTDTYACHRVIEEYGKHVASVIRDGGYTGDGRGALEVWQRLIDSEETFRLSQMKYVLEHLPPKST